MRCACTTATRGRVLRMHDGDTVADSSDLLNGDPYDILGVPRSASKAEIQRAYRLRARELHPDASGDPSTVSQFQEVVKAFRLLASRLPGSRETHPLWPYLSGLDQYWSREQGHDTADDLEEYLKDLGKFHDYVSEMLSDTGDTLASRSAPPGLSVGAGEESTVEDNAGEATASLSIRALLGYRRYLGNEQWQVRWSDGSSSWERLHVLNTEARRREARSMRDRQGLGS
jgi:hypothetical protein